MRQIIIRHDLSTHTLVHRYSNSVVYITCVAALETLLQTHNPLTTNLAVAAPVIIATSAAAHPSRTPLSSPGYGVAHVPVWYIANNNNIFYPFLYVYASIIILCTRDIDRRRTMPRAGCVGVYTPREVDPSA